MLRITNRITSISHDLMFLTLGVWLLGSLVLYATGLLLPLEQNIPFNHYEVDYLVTFFFQLTIFLFLYALPIQRMEKILLCFAWVLKSSSISILMPLYEFHYQVLDSYSYFSKGFNTNLYTQLVAGNGTHNMIVMSSFLTDLGFAYFRLQNAMFAGIGLLGLYFFHRTYQIISNSDSCFFLVLACAFPSMTFWSSILGKDPWTFFFISMFIFSFVHLKFKITHALWLLPLMVSLLGIYYVRPWMVQIIILSVVTWLILCGFLKLNRAVQFILLIVFLFLTLIFAQVIFEVVLTTNAYERLVRIARGWNRGGSALPLDFDFYSISGLLEFLIIGSFTALFRPLPGDLPGLFPLLSSLENLAFFGSFLICLPLFLKRIKNPVTLYFFVLVVMWALIYSFASYQNLGTAVRFRLQIMPVVLLIMSTDAEYLFQRFCRRLSQND